MKVGDFVRFKHDVIRANPGIALSNDKGIVVASNGSGSRVDVIWNDGDKGTFRARDLKRIPGIMGTAIRSMGEKRNPLRDKGRGPLTVPQRIIPAPMNNACTHDHYRVWGCAVIMGFRPTGNIITLKNGEKRNEKVPIISRRIHVHCKRSSKTWYYVQATRDKITTFSDSRDKGNDAGTKTINRLTVEQTQDAIARYAGRDATMIAWDSMKTDYVQRDVYMSIIGKA